MTLAQFYATHRSPQAIIVPRRMIRLGGPRRIAGMGAGAGKPSVPGARPPAADKKH
jgi:hypothetical protein